MSGLRPFLRRLEAAGELVRVGVPVDPRLEVTEIVTRVVRAGGPCLLFERPGDSSFPLLINAFGSPRRVELALGRHPARIGEEIRAAAERLATPSLKALWESRAVIGRALSMRTRHVHQGPVLEVTEEPPDLRRLPVLTCWPQDAGPYLTFAMTLTRDPATGRRNLGLYRLQVHGPAETGMHWQIEKGGGFHYWEAERRGEALPAAVLLGGDPAVLIAAALPLPEGMDELAFAGYLQRRPPALLAAPGEVRRAGALELLADAEFALVGEVPPGVRRREGPFGDHLGHYSAPADFPVLRVRRLYRRRDAIFPAAVVGKPPQEDFALGTAIQEMLTPLIRLLRPEVTALWAYGETGFHGLTVVAVRQRYPREAVKAALGLLGQGQLSLAKCIVLVDPTVDVRSLGATLAAVHAHFDPATDLVVIPGTAADTLEFTSGRMNLGSKMIVDATAAGDHRRPPLDAIALETIEKIAGREAGRWALHAQAVLAVQAPAGGAGREQAERLARESALAVLPLVVVVSEDVDVSDPCSLLWGWFTRFEPARDLVAGRAAIEGPVARLGPPLVFDSTLKPGYPRPVEMDPTVVKKVSRRWQEYGIGG